MAEESEAVVVDDMELLSVVLLPVELLMEEEEVEEAVRVRSY